MRLPQNNEDNSQHRGRSTTIRLRHNTNNEATSQQRGCITTLRLPHNNEATSQKWGRLTTLRLPLNIAATPKQWGCRLPYNIEAILQQWGYLTAIWLPHKNKATSQLIRLSHNSKVATQLCGFIILMKFDQNNDVSLRLTLKLNSIFIFYDVFMTVFGAVWILAT